MQGFNMGRYYPPSTDSPPSFNTGSSLRAASRKNVVTGVQTVRFEMPFHIWCGTCKEPTIIPQGVRFNAEKKKVGMYYSTPVWSFRMKHGACGGWVEIRTNPAASEYIVSEGGKKRDYGQESQDGLVLTGEERERRRNDAFASLEGKVEEKERTKKDSDRITELRHLRERHWARPDEANRRLRKEFRTERKKLQKEEANTEALKEKFSLNMDLLAETEEDNLMAGLVDFEARNSTSDVMKMPLFAETDPAIENTGMKVMTRSKREAVVSKARFAKELRYNTRATIDPFLSGNTRGITTRPLLGIKRKRSNMSDSKAPDKDSGSNSSGNISQLASLPTTNPPSFGLIAYDDSD